MCRVLDDRLRSPWLLSYVGERPPRLGLMAQIAVIYVVFLHIALWWEARDRQAASPLMHAAPS